MFPAKRWGSEGRPSHSSGSERKRDSAALPGRKLPGRKGSGGSRSSGSERTRRQLPSGSEAAAFRVRRDAAAAALLSSVSATAPASAGVVGAAVPATQLTPTTPMREGDGSRVALCAALRRHHCHCATTIGPTHEDAAECARAVAPLLPPCVVVPPHDQPRRWRRRATAAGAGRRGRAGTPAQRGPASGPVGVAVA